MRRKRLSKPRTADEAAERLREAREWLDQAPPADRQGELDAAAARYREVRHRLREARDPMILDKASSMFEKNAARERDVRRRAGMLIVADYLRDPLSVTAEKHVQQAAQREELATSTQTKPHGGASVGSRLTRNVPGLRTLIWQSADKTSAFVPADVSLKFPARCVCCLDPDVEVRAIETATWYYHASGTKTGTRQIEAVVPIRLLGVPYCSAHAAEHDAHLARNRMSDWERLRVRKKQMFPEPKRLADGSEAAFCAGYKREGGALGMYVCPQPALGALLQDPPVVVHAYTEIHFQNPEYAEMFREANSLTTLKEHERGYP